ncbi:unnamed protein product, partial [marine sediment metagenome]
MEEAISNGLRQILLITGQHKRAIEDHFDTAAGNGQGSVENGHLFPGILGNKDIDIFFVRQSRPDGLGDAIAHAKSFVGDEPFAIALGDAVLTNANHCAHLLSRMARLFAEKKPAGVVAVRDVPNELVSSYGIVKPSNGEGEVFRISDIVEKPAPHTAPSNLAVTARYMFSPQVFSYLADTPPDSSDEVQLTDAMRLMLQDGHDIWAMQLAPKEVRYDVGNFYGYAKAFIAMALADPDQGAALSQYLKELV